MPEPSNKTSTPIYTFIAPGDLWGQYADLPGLLRGGALVDGQPNVDVRENTDYKVKAVDGVPTVIFDGKKGMSFASNVDRLAAIPVKGKVWLLPRGSVLPEGLGFVLKNGDATHPMLAVTRDMPLVELRQKLADLAHMLLPTGIEVRGKNDIYVPAADQAQGAKT
jgi:hypothetical protein